MAVNKQLLDGIPDEANLPIAKKAAPKAEPMILEGIADEAATEPAPAKVDNTAVSRRPTPLTSVVNGVHPEEARLNLDFVNQVVDKYAGNEPAKPTIVPTKTGAHVYSADKEGVTFADVNTTGGTVKAKVDRVDKQGQRSTSIQAKNIGELAANAQGITDAVSQSVPVLSPVDLQNAQKAAKTELESSRQYVGKIFDEYKADMGSMLVQDKSSGATQPFTTLNQNASTQGMFSDENFMNRVFNPSGDMSAMTQFVSGATTAIAAKENKELMNLRSKYPSANMPTEGAEAVYGIGFRVDPAQAKAYDQEAAIVKQKFQDQKEHLMQAAHTMASLKAVNKKIDELGASRLSEIDPVQIGMDVQRQLGNSAQVKKDRTSMQRGKALDPETKVAYELQGYKAMQVATIDQFSQDRQPVVQELSAATKDYRQKVLDNNPKFVKQQITKALQTQIFKDENAFLSSVIDNDPTQEDIDKAAAKLNFSKEQIAGITPDDIQNPKVWYNRAMGSFLNNSAGGIYRLALRGAANAKDAIVGGVDWEKFNENDKDWYANNETPFIGGKTLMGGTPEGSTLFGDNATVNTDKNDPNYLMNQKSAHAGKFNWDVRAILNQVGEGAGQIAAFGYGGNKLSQAFQAGRTALMTEAAATALASDAAAVAKLGDQGMAFGTTVSTFLTQSADNYQDALAAIGDAPEDESKRMLYAGLKTASSAITEQIMPDAKIMNNLLGPGTSAGRELIELIRNEGVAGLKRSGSKIITQGLKEGIKDWQKEISEDVLDNLGGMITDAMLAPKQYQSTDYWEQQKQTYITSAISSAIPTIGGAVRHARTNNKMQRAMMFEVGSNPSTYIDDINKQIETGAFSQEEGNARIQIINTMSDIVDKHMPAESPVNGKPLTPAQRIDYGHNLLTESMLKAQVAQTEDEAQKKALEANIVVLQNQRQQMLETAGQVVAQPAAIVPETIAPEVTDPVASVTKPAVAADAPATEQTNTTAVQETVAPEEVVPPLNDAPLGQAITDGGVFTRNGEAGDLRLDGQTVVFETKDRVYELGNAEQLATGNLSDFGIEKEAPLNVEVNDDYGVAIDGNNYVNNYSNKEAAINYDQQGNVTSVNLETEDGKKRTIRGQRAQEIAYQYKLKSFEQNATDESTIDRAIQQAEEAIAVETTPAAATGQETVGNSEKPREAIAPALDRIAQHNLDIRTKGPGIDLSENKISNKNDNISYNPDYMYRTIGKDGYADFLENNRIRAKQETKQAYTEAYFNKGVTSKKYSGKEYIVEAVPSDKWNSDPSKQYFRPDAELTKDAAIRIYEMQPDKSYKVVYDNITPSAPSAAQEVVTPAEPAAPKKIKSKKPSTRLALQLEEEPDEIISSPQNQVPNATPPAQQGRAEQPAAPAPANNAPAPARRPANTATANRQRNAPTTQTSQNRPAFAATRTDDGIAVAPARVLHTTTTGLTVGVKENGDITVQNRKGKEAKAQSTRKKAILEAANASNFTQGQTASEEDYGDLDAVVRNSSNPAELAAVFIGAPRVSIPLTAQEEVIVREGMSPISRSSWEEFTGISAGEDNVSMYVREGGRDITAVADDLTRAQQGISDENGVEVTPEDIVAFARKYPFGMEADKEVLSPTAKEAAKKFRAITGFELKDNAMGDQIADIALNQFETGGKLLPAELELLNNEYETAEELRADYERAIAEGRIAPPSEIGELNPAAQPAGEQASTTTADAARESFSASLETAQGVVRDANRTLKQSEAALTRLRAQAAKNELESQGNMFDPTQGNMFGDAVRSDNSIIETAQRTVAENRQALATAQEQLQALKDANPLQADLFETELPGEVNDALTQAEQAIDATELTPEETDAIVAYAESNATEEGDVDWAPLQSVIEQKAEQIEMLAADPVGFIEQVAQDVTEVQNNSDVNEQDTQAQSSVADEGRASEVIPENADQTDSNVGSEDQGSGPGDSNADQASDQQPARAVTLPKPEPTGDTLQDELNLVNWERHVIDVKETRIERMRERNEPIPENDQKTLDIFRKRYGDRIRKLRISNPGLALSSPLAPARALWNAAVNIVATAVDAGVAIHDAIIRGIEHIDKYSSMPWDVEGFKNTMGWNAGNVPVASDIRATLIPNVALSPANKSEMDRAVAAIVSGEELLEDVLDDIDSFEISDKLKDKLKTYIDNALDEQAYNESVQQAEAPEPAPAQNNTQGGADFLSGFQPTAGEETAKYISGKTLADIFIEEPGGNQDYVVAKLNNMLGDGENMIAMAQEAWGEGVLEYGPRLYEYLTTQMADSSNKAVLMATFLGRLKEALLNRVDNQPAIRALYDRTIHAWQQYMRETSLSLNAARLLRLYRNKYLSDFFTDKILEEAERRERNKIQEAENDGEISDEIAEAGVARPVEETIAQEKQKAAAVEQKASEKKKDTRKAGPANEYKEKAEKRIAEVSGKNSLLDKIKEQIKKINCP